MASPEPIIWYNAAGDRWCTRCAAYMTPALFHRNRASSAGDGLQRICKLCTRDLRRQTYQRNREREIAAARAWQAAHPEQARVSKRRASRVYTRLHADRRHAQYVQRRDRRAAWRDEREEQTG